MRIRPSVLALLAGLAIAAPLHAAQFKAGSIEIDDVWVRASAPGQTNGAGYLEIDNDGPADRLVSVRSDAAERTELHTVVTENGVAKMRELEQGLAIPADGDVDLKPGGHHIMFMGLKAPFAEGGSIPAILRFEKAGEVRVNFTVRSISYRDDGNDHAGHGGHEGHMSGMKH